MSMFVQAGLSAGRPRMEVLFRPFRPASLLRTAPGSTFPLSLARVSCTSDRFIDCRRGSSRATAAARRGHTASCDAAGIFKPDATIALFVFHQLAAHH